MRLMILVCAILATFAANAAGAIAIEGLQGFGDTRHHLLESAETGSRYHVLVGLPEDYDDTAGEHYPVLYILDGGELYPLLRAYHRYLVNGREAPQMILVGISYGTGDWRLGNARSHDYTAPAPEREHWGGAGAFRDFLAGELLPFVEGRYRARSNRRIIFGQSIGGQFVLYTAQTAPTLFWGHIASNPALHRNLDFYLEARDYPDDRPVSNLFVAAGADDDPEFRGPVETWISRWETAGDRPWRLGIRRLDGHSHFSAPPAALRQGMLWLFPDTGERQPIRDP
jgi:predicted alpha/beta superfamily hydrolase